MQGFHSIVFQGRLGLGAKLLTALKAARPGCFASWSWSLLGGEGVAEDEFLDSVNFLASEGYIHLRLISTREPALLADHEYTELEAKLTSQGKRLLKGDIEDNMTEI